MTTRSTTMTTTTRCRSTTAIQRNSPTKSNASSATTAKTPSPMGRATSGASLLAAEAARATRHGADVQYSHTDGVIDLTWGHPDPSALASDVVAEATDAVLTAEGWKALTYGAPAGAMVVRAAIAEHDSSVDHPIRADEVLITAGSSGALDLILSLRTVPGD